MQQLQCQGISLCALVLCHYLHDSFDAFETPSLPIQRSLFFASRSFDFISLSSCTFIVSVYSKTLQGVFSSALTGNHVLKNYTCGFHQFGPLTRVLLPNSNGAIQQFIEYQWWSIQQFIEFLKQFNQSNPLASLLEFLYHFFSHRQ